MGKTSEFYQIYLPQFKCCISNANMPCKASSHNTVGEKLAYIRRKSFSHKLSSEKLVNQLNLIEIMF